MRIDFHIECLWRKFVSCVSEVDRGEELGIAHSGGRHVRNPYGLGGGIRLKCQKLKPGEKLRE